MQQIVGNEDKKKQLDIAIESAKLRNVSVPHLLFEGAPGCGKTSMARYVAERLDCPFLSVVPDDIDTKEALLSVFDRFDTKNYDNLGNRTGKITPTILFLDEIHNLPKKAQELLGLAMERFIIESGEPNKYYWIPYFTVIGATTMTGKLNRPFLDRFKLIFQFQTYDISDMEAIIKAHAYRLKIPITPGARLAVAKRSKGTPRIAVGHLERIRDKMLVVKSKIVTRNLVEETFEEAGIDSEGFTQTELNILRILNKANGPVGLDNLAVMLQQDSKNIKDSAESYLIKRGLVAVNGRGRQITDAGRNYIKASSTEEGLNKELIDFNYERT